MNGQWHIRIDLCKCPREQLESRAPLIVEKILATAKEAGANIKDYSFRPFEPEEGYTLFVVIEESHFIIQTWPEWEFVNIDVVMCNYSRDNSELARSLARSLKDFFGGIICFSDETRRGPWEEL